MCYSLWYNAPTMLPAGNIVGALYHKSSAPEDGQNICPKYVELIGINDKQLLLHLFGCLYYLQNNLEFHLNTVSLRLPRVLYLHAELSA